MSNQSNYEKMFEQQVKEQIEKLDSKIKMVLELSRLTYYKSEIINKLWHEVKEDHEEKEATISQENSKQREAVSDSKQYPKDDHLDEILDNYNQNGHA